MIRSEFISTCALLGDPNYSSYATDYLDVPLELKSVKAVFPNDEITEEEDFFVLHRCGNNGESCILRMPKELMEFKKQMRFVFDYTACNKLDQLLGFEDTIPDYGGSTIYRLGESAKYGILYLSVQLEYPKEDNEPLVAIITKPGPGTTLFAWVAGHLGTAISSIIEELSANGLSFTVLQVDEKKSNVLFAIDADCKGINFETQAAWDAYWANVIESISYTTNPGGYG